jgi:hypothetical protein
MEIKAAWWDPLSATPYYVLFILILEFSHISLQLFLCELYARLFTRHLQYNFYPNDGECVKPSTIPPNEFSAGALNNDASKSWRFFLNQNSQACRGGVTTMSMITNGKIFGGVSNYDICYFHSHHEHFLSHSLHLTTIPGAVRLVRQRLC